MMAFIKKYAVLLVAGILLAGAVYVNVNGFVEIGRAHV